MNLEQLIEETQSACKFGGYAGQQPAPDYAKAVNTAYKWASTESEYNTEDSTFPTVVGQAEYNLITASPSPADTRDWIRITDVLLGTLTRLEQTDDVQLRSYDWLWTQATNGTPSLWMMSAPNVMRLYQPPSDIQTVHFHGSREVGPLTSGQVPTFPSKYHETVIPLHAAWLILRKFATGSSYQRALAYRDEAQAKIAAFKAELQDQRTVVFRRKMQRHSPERLMLGSRYLRV